MTVVAVYKADDRYWIASDSSAASGYFDCRSGPKFIYKGNYIMGFCGSFRLRDIIEDLDYEDEENLGLPEDCLDLHDAKMIRDTIRDSVSSDRDIWFGDEDRISDVIIVSQHGMWVISLPDYQIHEITQDYYAIGGGAEVATGAMYGLKQVSLATNVSLEGKFIVKKAVAAAIEYITICSGPIHTESVKRIEVEET